MAKPLEPECKIFLTPTDLDISGPKTEKTKTTQKWQSLNGSLVSFGAGLEKKEFSSSMMKVTLKKTLPHPKRSPKIEENEV